MKKVMVISYDFPPYSSNWGASQRCYFLVNALIKNNYDVSVVCNKEKEKNGIYKINKDAVYPLENFNVLTKNKQEKTETTKITEKNSISRMVKIIKIAKKMFSYINMEILKDQSGMGVVGLIWALKNKNKILKLIEEKSIDIVIISVPPFYISILNRIIKKKNKNIKVILDYRDPWSLWKKNFITETFEKIAIKNSDIIIAFSDKFEEDIILKYRRDNVFTIYNGFSEDAWGKIQAKTNNELVKELVTFSFIGNISFNGGYRNPENVINAFNIFSENKNVELKFIGVTSIDESKTNAENIKINGPVNYEQSLEEMLKSDVLINIHIPNDNSSKYIIPGKFFDYLRSGKRILSIGDEKNLIKKLFRSTEGVYFSMNDTTDIVNNFEKIYKEIKNENVVKLNRSEEFNTFSRENQNDLYVNIIDKIFDKK